MSDNSSPPFGSKPAESPKNPKVYGIPVKIDPYTSVRPGPPTGTTPRPPEKKDERPFDPFGVVIESPKGGG